MPRRHSFMHGPRRSDGDVALVLERADAAPNASTVVGPSAERGLTYSPSQSV